MSLAAMLGAPLPAHDARLRADLQRLGRPAVVPSTQAVESVGNAMPIDDGAAWRSIAHRRLLGNGHCTRPVLLDCSHHTMCEGCGFFETGPEFVSILRRQRDSAEDLADFERAKIFTELVDGMTTDKPPRPGLPACSHESHDDQI